MKKFKGFTLIELIIVMAILAILMAAIMQMFKPVRATYVDSTLYENQRTTQNGIVQYITESVRYASDLGLYTKTDIGGGITKAVDEFIAAYCTENSVNKTDAVTVAGYTNVEDYIKKNAEVIIIDNTANMYSFGSGYHIGRILRRKLDGSAISADNEDPSKNKKCRLALGSAYYGDADYTISITVEAKGQMAVSVASDISKGGKELFAGNKITVASGFILCKNLSDDYGVADTGTFDTAKYSPTNATGSNTKVYIVYLNQKVPV